VDLSQLPECVSVICGKPPYHADWGGIDSSYNAMIMVGFHARSGVAGALLPHSYSRKNLNIRLNGTVVGEIGMEAAIAGDFDVPLWLVTGDSAGMSEAEQMIKNVRTVTVKEAMGEFAARCLPPRLTSKLIYEAARNLISSPPDVQPLKYEPPVEMQIELSESDYREKLRIQYPDLFVNESTVQIQKETVTEVWAKYLQIQIESKV
jgi:D-amino peptidase